MKIVKKRLYINGMTCISCQNRIEKKLLETPGIKAAKVSYNKGTADIAYDTDEISLKNVTGIIEALDYSVERKRTGAGADTERIVWMLVLIVSLYILLEQFGILNLLVPGQLADGGMGYGMLFLVGLLSSLHCIAMCGGINLSCCIAQKDAAGRAGTFVPALAYNVGRVISYTVIGFLLGLAGMLVGGGAGGGISAFLQGILKLIAGVFMVIMGINMLELFPWLKKFGLRMPKAFAAAINKQKGKGSGPFLIGLLNGLMPCGPLQSVQIVALASLSPFVGALSMLFFSLGTIPLMLGLGSLVAALGRRFAHTVTRVGAVLVTVLGLAMLSQGVNLSGLMTDRQLLVFIIAFCVLGVIGSVPAKQPFYRAAGILAACAVLAVLGAFGQQGLAMESQNGVWEQTVKDDQQQTAKDDQERTAKAEGIWEVTSTLTLGKYPNITVKAGIPVRWVINAPKGSINGCNYKMLIREYGLEHTFSEGENVIEFTPTEAGTITYTCWMGMIKGTIFVMPADDEQEDAGQDADSAQQEAVAAEDEAAVASGLTASKLQEDTAYPSAYRIPAQELAVAKKETSEDGSSVQNVEITLTQDGFSPAVVVVESGVETNWTIHNERSASGESDELLAVLYATTLPLASGKNTLYLYPVESFDVSTGDSAFYAYVKVVDDLESFDEDAVRREVEAYEPYVYPASAFEGAQSGASCCY